MLCDALKHGRPKQGVGTRGGEYESLFFFVIIEMTMKTVVVYWLVSAILFVGTCEPHACAWFGD